MRRRLTVKENEAVRIPKGDEMAMQLESMHALVGDRCLGISRTPTGISAVPSMVGHYRFRDGSEMDVVPKMGDRWSATSNRALTDMMYSIFNIKGKSDEMNLFEFFVKVFITEVMVLVRKGFRSAYATIQGNETVFKGRLLFADNIRENLVHRERVYVEYELFTPDRPENRVVKTTLESLVRQSHDDRNLREIKILLMCLEDIPSSPDLAKDLGACRIDRNMTDYESPLMWCSVFLGSKGRAFALLADPENVFEAYVARCSSRGRNGSLSVGCVSETVNDGVSVTVVTIRWQYRAEDGTLSHDAEFLYTTAPGYARIPLGAGNRIRAMAAECREGRAIAPRPIPTETEIMDGM